jgi:hypothetical protein
MNIRSVFSVVGGDLYQAAIQNPSKVFKDPELQRGTIERRNGLPFARSGGFAMVYRLSSRDTDGRHQRQLAVRCFKNLPEDLADRYRAICAEVTILAARSNNFVSTRYIPDGIRIGADWKPITTMTWVDGQFLDHWIDENFGEPHRMQSLFERVRRLAEDLNAHGVAHGDLHRGNILVTGSDDPRLTLIDYDAMYVPALKGRHSNEGGHPDYQHPLRSAAHYSGALDRFAFIALLLNTMAIQRHPELWEPSARSGEGLLTGQLEYTNPDSAPILDRLEAYADLTPAVRMFRSICKRPFEDIPSPREFLAVLHSGTPMVVTAVSAAPAATQDQLPDGGRPQTTGGERATGAAPDESSQAVEAEVAPVVSNVSTPGSARLTPRISPTLRQLSRSIGDRVEIVGPYVRFSSGDGLMQPYRTLYVGHPGSPPVEIRVDQEVARDFARMKRKWRVRSGIGLSITGLLLRDGGAYYVDLEYPSLLYRLDERVVPRGARPLVEGEPSRSSPPGPHGAAVAYHDILKVMEGTRKDHGN